ncbi:MAG: YqaJ viral recombinase family protein [Gammaproteobacteria bacterium]
MEYKVEQRSDEWFKLRIGKITCSNFGILMPTPRQKTEWNDTQLKILREIAAEIITQEREESYTSSAMQWGIDQEDNARYLFQAQEFETVRTCGFFELSEYVGGSPDGIIVRDGEDWGNLETKCPTSKQHLLYELDKDELFKAYKYQVLGQCLVTELLPYALCSYDPRFPDSRQLIIIRGVATDEDLKPLRDRLDSAIALIRSWI